MIEAATAAALSKVYITRLDNMVVLRDCLAARWRPLEAFLHDIYNISLIIRVYSEAYIKARFSNNEVDCHGTRPGLPACLPRHLPWEPLAPL